MADQRIKSSPYRFTDPIRIFKANDPYYYEVDNIPLKQIHENCLWLKDQVSGTLELEKVERSDIDELRPYVAGNGNVVKVRPGRYTARINDVKNLEPLQHITAAEGASIGQTDEFDVVTLNNTLISNALTKLFAYQAENVLNMNGMCERIFSYPTATTEDQITFGVQGATYAGLPDGKNRPGFPINELFLWRRSNEQTSYRMKGFLEENLSIGYGVLNVLESYFVKKWRGVARTAVVDIPEELEIVVPPFSVENDFFYIGDNGERILIPGPTHRIDLLFIYSKPIDTSAATISKWTEPYSQETTPPTITRAELGILKGAGIGVSNQNTPDPERNVNPQRARDFEGHSLMAAGASDEFDVLNGFTRLNIHGSFPAPDDLLNVTPILTEYAQLSDLRLVGQTILPLAYIVVRKDASLNSQNNPILTEDDLIDIRPFFRTTELSYNERAGIAAALPALSLANPAVGKFQLDREVQVAYKSLKSEINELDSRIGGVQSTTPRVVAAGYVMGGAYYGVEGTMIDFFKQAFLRNLTWEQLKTSVRERLGYPLEVSISDFPDWDLANWARGDTGLENPGLYPNDYVDCFYNKGTNMRYSNFRDLVVNPENAARSQGFGTDNINGEENVVAILYCRKRITINRAAVPWMRDYHVEAQFVNCTPLTTRAMGNDPAAMASPAGIWVSKEPNGFTIYCAWVANDLNPTDGQGTKRRLMGGYPLQATPKNNRQGHWFAGMAVTHPAMDLNTSNPFIAGMTEFGAAIYPTVSFQVIGYPISWGGYVGRLDGNVISFA